MAFGQFNAYIGVCLTGGVILSFTYIMYEFWRFIEPGQRKKFFSKNCYSNFFTLLVWHTFWIFRSLFNDHSICLCIQRKSYFKNVFDLSDYVNTIIQSTLSMVKTFPLPIFVYFLRTYRKHAFLVLLIRAAALSPGDALNIFMAPILLLYELSINVSLTKSRTSDFFSHVHFLFS